MGSNTRSKLPSATVVQNSCARSNVSFALQIPGNSLSRGVEGSADIFALRLTSNPAAFIAVQRKLALQNLADPDPPGWLTDIFGTHPPATDRIGYALRFERESGVTRP